jgi:hypothetical protein
MEHKELVVETRELNHFDQVTLRGNMCCAEIMIEQGDVESLTIEGERQVVRRVEGVVRDGRLFIRLGGSWMEKLGDLMTQDLSKPKLNLRLKVRQINSLDLYTAAAIYAPSIETEILRINWRGAGHLAIELLTARRLEMIQSGAGSVEIAGQVEHQLVSMTGAGTYDASKLLSDRTEVQLIGSSFACVQVTEELMAVVRGVGVVEYIGNPQVRSRLNGMGSIVRVG